MPAVKLISLDNLEQLQEEWAASPVAQDSGASQPTLNSPRSLEACRRAGIDAHLDLSKSTLSGVLIETLHKLSADGTAELPLQQRDVGATVTSERVKVLQLFPFSLRNVGTDEDKLRAYEKHQQREGRRVSTIRMLREIRQQLINAEEFKLRKAHELAAAAAVSAQSNRTSSPPPKPKTPARATAGGTKLMATRTPTSSLRDSSLRDSVSPQDDRSDISLSTVSEATAQARLTRKTIRDHNVRTSPPRTRNSGAAAAANYIANNNETTAYAKERKSFYARVSERSKSYGSEAHGAVSSADRRGNEVGDVGSDSDDDGDMFVHHARSDRADGVEFIHYVSGGPDLEELERRTHAAYSAADMAKRQQKRKETERLAAIERERKQMIVEDEERAYIRNKILKDRNAHRMIQTPAPPVWNNIVSSSSNETLLIGHHEEAPHPPLIDLAGSTASIKIHRGFNDDASKEPSQSGAEAPSVPRTPPINMEAIVSASLARAPSPTGTTASVPPVGPPQPPRSAPSSPLTTPRVGTPRDTVLSIQQTQHQRRGSGGSASELGLRNSPRAAPATPPRPALPAVDPFELSAVRRREVIEAATALRIQHGLWLAEENSPLVSPSKGEFDATNRPTDNTFDFSSREERVRAIEAHRSESAGHHRTVTEQLIHSRDDNRDERWRAVERARRAQDMHYSRPTTSNDVARHAGTIFM
ncbi:Hypothetical protein, putative [Bodo saltans]|uniref:Uncharacterized protein n=1 Tax=Bodo saltans TaxID=75058 RepID=A0A0S4J0L0_BODSA|nr:Hypothetical protein, putative [Bodo saltans]|eukprot:CUG43176.1 Hypothetical protein, putative [Bodo saltans]